MNNSPLIRKAVFPVAGLGTRFLPATKANPKEMLPVVDKPLIQYAVEEAIAAGITELIFVTSMGKHAIEDHFDTNFELEAKLAEKQKTELLKTVQNILPKGVTSVYVRQHQPLGLGHAVLCAKNIVGDQPFAVLLADDLIDSGDQVVCMRQMVDAFQAARSSLIAVQRIPIEDSDKYGIVELAGEWKPWATIRSIIEKPAPAVAPSNLAAVGRYILTPQIFHLLEQVTPGAGNEIQLTDAIAALLKQESVAALEFKGIRYDCGSKLGYMKASIALALKHPEIGASLKAYLETFS